MTRLERHGPRLAWGSLVLAILIVGVTVAIASATPEASLPAAERRGPDLVFGLVYLGFAIVGALVASRKPTNPIGWLFVAFGLVGVGIGLTGTWALDSLYVEGSVLPAGRAAAWIGAAMGVLLVPPLILMLLLFPDGRLPGRRWGVVAWLSVPIPVLSSLAAGLTPGPLGNLRSVQNPLGIDGAEAVLDPVAKLGIVVGLGLLLAAAASLVLRFRSSEVQERQQIKWFAAGAVFAAVLFGGVLATVFIPSFSDSEGATEVTDVLVALAFTALPLTAGIAILRNGLWDIDLVINRTLVYAGLTAILAGAYAIAVLLLQLVLSPLTQESNLAVAGSTLAVAALFRPARGRVQAGVDRRFYRRRYDAARTLEAFGQRLREEVSLDSLHVELREVVADTLEPAHVSLWLHPRTAPLRVSGRAESE